MFCVTCCGVRELGGCCGAKRRKVQNGSLESVSSVVQLLQLPSYRKPLEIKLIHSPNLYSKRHSDSSHLLRNPFKKSLALITLNVFFLAIDSWTSSMSPSSAHLTRSFFDFRQKTICPGDKYLNSLVDDSSVVLDISMSFTCSPLKVVEMFLSE